MEDIKLIFKCELDNYQFEVTVRLKDPNKIDTNPRPCPICNQIDHVKFIGVKESA